MCLEQLVKLKLLLAFLKSITDTSGFVLDSAMMVHPLYRPLILGVGAMPLLHCRLRPGALTCPAAKTCKLLFTAGP